MTINDIFSELKPPEADMPQGLEQEVFSSLETLQLIADVLDLFTSQFIRAEAELSNMLGASFDADEEGEA